VGDPNVLGRNSSSSRHLRSDRGNAARFKWDDAESTLPLKVSKNAALNFGASLKLRPGVTPAQADAELPAAAGAVRQGIRVAHPILRVDCAASFDLAPPLVPCFYLLLGASHPCFSSVAHL